ncbi:MAG TPA: phosphoribosylanthranilate isomerase [Chthoniobacterales bacterium]|nr:phosphoribosylanthranilate isomerase [Chthoniobacterales bacterium]
MKQVQVKICGVANVHDARACAELGANMIGLNFYRQSPRYIAPEIGREIVAAIGNDACPVGVFVEPKLDQVRELAQTVGFTAVQLHGNVSPALCDEFARDFRVIRALCTSNRFRPVEAAQFRSCDVLLDAAHPQLHGGTGITCDWSAARATLPFTRFLILSGGLSAQNVGAAIAAVQPHAVDVCSGVELAPGAKDRSAMEQFITAVRASEAAALTPPA